MSGSMLSGSMLSGSTTERIPLKTEELNKLMVHLQEKTSKATIVWEWVQNFMQTEEYKKLPKNVDGDLKFANSHVKNSEGKAHSVYIGKEGYIYDEFYGTVYRTLESFTKYDGIDTLYEQIRTDQVYNIIASSI